MAFKLNDETAADVLIFWMQSSDGAISYWEDEAVKDVLSKMHYTMRTYRDTVSHLGAISTDNLKSLVLEARQHVRTNYDQEQKALLIDLLEAVANSDKNEGKVEHEKLENLHEEFGV